MTLHEIEILKRALNREKAARKQAEGILEQKSDELYKITLELQRSNDQLENLIKRKTNELQGVFENIIDAYVVVDLKGNVLKMNDAAKDLFQFPSVDTQANLLKLVHPDDFNKSIVAFNGLLVNGTLTDFDVKIVTKNQDIKYVHVNSSLIYENGKPVAAQGIARDMTEDRLKAELIQEQKNQLDIIVDNSSFGILLTQDGYIMKSNKAFGNLLGYNSKELENLFIDDISHSNEFSEFRKLNTQMNSGELDVFTLEKGFVKKDGSSIWTKTTVNAVRFFSGSVKYKVLLIEDITKDLENNLMFEVINTAAKAILGKVNVSEISSEIVNIIGKYLGTDDCIIYLLDSENERLEQIACYGFKSIEYNSNEKMYIPTGVGIVGNVANSGVGEIVNDVSKDARYIVGSRKMLSEIAVPIISDGRVLGVIDSESPVKNYFSEAHLKTLTNIARIVSMQLASAISISEKLKTEEKNTQLMKDLEKSNVELQEYAHVVSHDLKSPLRSINALVSWLREDNEDTLDNQSIENIQMIENTLENMEQLISDVLDYSSVTTNKMKVELVDLNEVVSSIISDIKHSSAISIEVLNKLPKIKGDRTRFKQVFQNLISNAIKYNNEENGFVKIKYTKTKTHHKFAIEDNGIGIEKKYFDKIFQIFQALKPSKDSTGVGLSIVKKIVDLYQGEIWLESEVGEGTTFHFTLKKS